MVPYDKDYGEIAAARPKLFSDMVDGQHEQLFISLKTLFAAQTAKLKPTEVQRIKFALIHYFKEKQGNKMKAVELIEALKGELKGSDQPYVIPFVSMHTPAVSFKKLQEFSRDLEMDVKIIHLTG